MTGFLTFLVVVGLGVGVGVFRAYIRRRATEARDQRNADRDRVTP